jgi:glycosyltransferase involved in cell wall biosynthesis
MVGRRPRRELLAHHNGEDIVVTGGVPNVAEYYGKATVAVVPLRSGGGTRLKILEAMAFGVPVVSTSVGCEGLQVEHGKHLLIADEPSAFVDAIGSLFEDAALRPALVSSARRLVEDNYDWHVVASLHDRLYNRLREEALSEAPY